MYGVTTKEKIKKGGEL